MKYPEWKGMFYIFISALLFGTYGIWSRLMVGVFEEFSQAWIRALLLLLFLIPIGMYRKSFKKIERKDMKWFFIISLSGGLNQAPYYYAFQHLTIGTATLLFYTALTIGTYIIGGLFFKEKITFIKFFSLLLAIIGMYYIYSFSLNSRQLLPAVITVLAGFMGAVEIVLSKKISDRYSKFHILTTIFLATLVANVAFSAIYRETIPALAFSTAWLAQIAYTVSMVAAITTAFIGFSHIREPSIGGLIGLFEILFGILFGALFFHESLTYSMLLGGTIILMSIALPDLLSLLKKNCT